MCKFIGLDISIRSSGVVVLDRHGDLISSEVIESKKAGIPDIVRFNSIVRRIIQAAAPKPDDVIVIESYAFMAKGQLTRLAELGGILKNKLYTSKFISPKCVLMVSPSILKKFVTGSGKSKKSKMMLSVYKKWGFSSPNDDECDAFGLAKLGYALYSREDNWKKYELECVNSVIKQNKLSDDQLTYLLNR